MRSRLSNALALASVLLLAGVGLVSADAGIPAHNDARLREPPPRPPIGDAEAKARRLFEAIQRDDPDSILDFFLPRDAFARIKAIAEPNRRYDVLVRAYVEDIHELHQSLPNLDRATYDHLELVRRGGWVTVGEEGNRLPYWVSRHSLLHYRVDGRPRSFEVRVLITWDDHWYVTHLNEFH